MIITYKQMRDQILRLLDETATGSPTTLELIKDALNAAHQQRCMEYPWEFLRWPKAETLTIVPGQHLYALHPEFGSPLYFRNTLSLQLLKEISQREIPTHDLGAPAVGSEHFFWNGVSPVSRQPSAAGALTLVSSSTGDSGSAYDIVIKGEDGSGTVQAEVLTPTGTSPVTSTKSFAVVMAVTRGATWAGDLTLTDAAGNTLLNLDPGELGRQHRLIYVLEQGLSGETISYRFQRKPLWLINDWDIPDIPAPFSQLLVWDALVQLGGYLTETNAQTLQIWRSKQMEAQVALYQAYANEQQTLGADPTYIRYVEDEIS